MHRSELKRLQRRRLGDALRIASSHPFYRDRADYAAATTRLETSRTEPDEKSDFSDVSDCLRDLPFLNKSELVTEEGTAAVFALPRHRYVRWHQTSGTTGHPMIVRDTAEDWRWWIDCWHDVLAAADVTADDTALMAFSFGPFIGFWTANDALVDLGATVIPGGGLTSTRRVELLMRQKCTVLLCTPTYALHLSEVARQMNVDLSDGDVRRIIVAGEPGGSLPAVRRSIQTAFGGVVIDHAGGSEIGAWGYGDAEGRGLYVNEKQFVAEVFDFENPQTPRPIHFERIDFDASVAHEDDAATGELVLTALGRHGGPMIRYRTGDIVRPAIRSGRLMLIGGVIGRADDMVVIRGVNVFPSAVEQIIRELTPAEYRVEVTRAASMDQLSIELEDAPEVAASLAVTLASRLSMRVPVASVPPDTLPRSEAKSRRWIDRR